MSFKSIALALPVARILANKRISLDWLAGRDCVWHCAESSWWEWDMGSRPMHWRWKEDYHTTIRDGLPLWFISTPPEYKVPQRGEIDVALREKIKEKLRKVRERRYLQPGPIKALTSFFTVPKGDDDIRVVYNGTKSGLNDCLWAPWFRLPTVEQHLRAVEPGTFMADLDIGEQFLNFMLHPKVQQYAGVDFTLYFPESMIDSPGAKQKCTLWERWTRCGMGFKPSPYQAGQAMLHAEEQLRGDPLDPNNPFHFDVVVLNLPGDKEYNPSRPWVFKSRSLDGRIANDFFNVC